MLKIIQSLQDIDSNLGVFLTEDTIDTSTFFSYAKIYEKILNYMGYFQELGVQKGTRVIFPFETTAEVIFSFFALVALGGIPLSIKPYLLGSPKQDYLSFILKIFGQYKVDFILETPSLKKIEIALPKLALPASEFQAKPALKFLDYNPEEIAFVQFSSGSTSLPKGVPITHNQIMVQLQMIEESAQPTPEDRVASWLPLYHDMGLIGTFLATFKSKNSLYLSTPQTFLLNPLGWLHFLSKNLITITAIPDFAIGYCLRQLKLADVLDLEELNLEKLRFVYNGSEPINVDNLNKFREFLEPYGLKSNAIKPCYGMAEAVLMISCTSLEDTPRSYQSKNGIQSISLGKPISEFSVRIKNESGHLCDEDEIGEIELKGGSLVGEYFEDDRLFFNSDGFFATGDLGFFNQGELFITGRLNDRIKINGQSYFANDFEQAVESLSFIRPGRTAVIQANGRIVVLIEVKQKEILQQSLDYQRQISQAIFNKTGIKISLEDILFIRSGQLMKTSSGKLRRNAIAQAYLSGEITLAAGFEKISYC